VGEGSLIFAGWYEWGAGSSGFLWKNKNRAVFELLVGRRDFGAGCMEFFFYDVRVSQVLLDFSWRK
jgi:hypothetical protein